MPLPAIVAALLPTLIDKIFGKKGKMTMDDNGHLEVTSKVKCLIRSKTTGFATGLLIPRTVRALRTCGPPRDDRSLEATVLTPFDQHAVSITAHNQRRTTFTLGIRCLEQRALG